MIGSEDYDRLLGALDAIQQSIIEIALELSSKSRNSIASEVDMYGANAERDCLSKSRAEGRREMAWAIAKPIWHRPVEN